MLSLSLTTGLSFINFFSQGVRCNSNVITKTFSSSNQNDTNKNSVLSSSSSSYHLENKPFCQITNSKKMLTSSVHQMQEADRRAIHELGIPGCVLMYNAGKTVVDYIEEKYKNAKNVGILCGKGNNAGDGFVIAHLLSLKGRSVRIVCLASPEQYVGDAAIYLKLCQNLHLNLIFPKDRNEAIQETEKMKECDLIIDALLGTGTRGTVREPFASVITAIPSGIPVVAVDLPSGMNGDTGEICGVCVKASATISFVRAKAGLVGHPELTGELIVTDIGMPEVCVDDSEWDQFKSQNV